MLGTDRLSEAFRLGLIEAHWTVTVVRRLAWLSEAFRLGLIEADARVHGGGRLVVIRGVPPRPH